MVDREARKSPHSTPEVLFSEIDRPISVRDYFQRPGGAHDLPNEVRAQIYQRGLAIIGVLFLLAVFTFMLSTLMVDGTSWKLDGQGTRSHLVGCATACGQGHLRRGPSPP
jgi:hypothetical protein